MDIIRKVITFDGNGRNDIWDCQIECEECPFRYRCYTQNTILRIHFAEYLDECRDKGIKLITVGNELRRLK